MNQPPSELDNPLKVAQAMQDRERVLENEKDLLRNQMRQLEVEKEYEYNERSQKGNAIMDAYEDMGGPYAHKSDLSSEMM